MALADCPVQEQRVAGLPLKKFMTTHELALQLPWAMVDPHQETLPQGGPMDQGTPPMDETMISPQGGMPLDPQAFMPQGV